MIRPSAIMLRHGLLAGASVLALVVTASAGAAPFGRRTGAADPAAAAVRAAETAATRNVAATAATARTRAAFDQAAKARRQIDGVQAAARAAALAGMSSIPNGLGVGGLQVAGGVTTDPTLWTGANGPTQAAAAGGRTTVTVAQTASKAILTWDSFNVGRETDLVFAQAGSDWSVLNRVTTVTADPSKILGTIKALGSVYIINRNGIVFGGASQVNVRSLTASSLDIDAGAIEYSRPNDTTGTPVSDTLWEQAKIAARNARFVGGLITGAPVPAFGGILATDSSGIPLPIADKVVVEAGGQITVASLGQVVLLGHDVTNAGTLVAPDGQVLLGAGTSLYLERGVDRVKSDGFAGPSNKIRGYVVSSGGLGEVRNDGLIVADRGNVTLHGENVTQNGVLAVTTGISAAGSIILDASTNRQNGLQGVQVGSSYNFGELAIGADSHMSILPDGGTRTVVGNPFLASTVEMIGNTITLGDRSTLYAPGAAVYAINPFSPNGRFYLGKDATIDVSGLGGVEVAMSQNEIKAELRANELRDNPVLRDGALRGETVYFDGRLGKKLTDGTGIADLSGWYDLVPRRVDQFMTTAGSVLLGNAQVITREGSRIDLSGGSVHYAGGNIRHTRLIDEFGGLVSIENADAKVRYVGIEGDTIVDHVRWGITERFSGPFARNVRGQYQPGYDEGRSAGLLTVTAGQGTDQARIFDGTIRADVVEGQYQVAAPGASSVTAIATGWRQRPALATLEFSNADPFGGSLPYGGNITIANDGPRLDGKFAADTELFDLADGYAPQVEGIVAFDHVLPASWFDGKTFGNVSMKSGTAVFDTHVLNPDGSYTAKPGHLPIGGVLTIGAGVNVDLGDFGKFDFVGRQVALDGTIRAAGGTVRLQAVLEPKLLSLYDTAIFDKIPVELLPGLHLGSAGVIDVAGKWSNNALELRDGAALTRPVVDGGSVTILAHNVGLDAGSRIDVSGGAHLAVGGKAPVLGNGGSILIDNSHRSEGQTVPSNGQLALNGALVGYAPGRGASLTIDTSDKILIGGPKLLQDGKLAAGEAAPIDVLLARETILKAGTTLPFDAAYTSRVAAPGSTLAAPVDFYIYSDLVIGADWTVIDGAYVQDNQGNPYSSGATVPAGTILVYGYGNLPAGYVFPADVFPDGFSFLSGPGSFVQPAGVLEADFALPSGFVIVKGTILEQAVEVTPPKTYDPAFFTQGGFASYALSGSQGLTVRAGTVIAPSVDTLVLGDMTERATGTRIGDLAGVAGSGVTLVNSASLPEAERPAMDLILSTLGTNINGTRENSRLFGEFQPLSRSQARSPGDVTLEGGTAIRMNGGSRVFLDSVAGITVDGTIDTPGGVIRIGGMGASDSGNSGTRIRIGEAARLTARGYQETRDDGSEIVRTVRGGGKILIGGSEISLDRAVAIGAGTVLDVSGVRGITDLGLGTSADVLPGRPNTPLQGVAVDGAAGEIAVYGTTGIVAGQMLLAAGGPTGRDGRLSVTGGGTSLIVRQSNPVDLDPVGAGSVIPDAGLTLVVDAVHGAGELLLSAPSGPYALFDNRGMVFDGSVALVASRSITLDADGIQRTVDPEGTAGTVSLAAPYVHIGGFRAAFPRNGDAAYATDLDGSFTVRAGLIDLQGNVDFGCVAAGCDLPGSGGFGKLLFQSTGDIRLIPGAGGSDQNDAARLTGGISSGGEIAFDAAQLYVTNGDSAPYSGNQYERADTDPGFLVRAGEKIVVRSNGAAAPVPLNFGERLTMRAPVIEQGGVVRAPAGQIRLEASERLTLLPGSLTSVSLDGAIVPFGFGSFEGYDRADWAPTRSVSLDGAIVDMQAGAAVDISGGGDLLAWSFQAGNGGTTDIMANRSVDGAFAILPSLGNRPAPVHPSTPGQFSTRALQDARLTVGDTIWLGASAGVAAGYYTLLPSYYALLDGGVLVRPMGGSYATPIATVRRDDGALVTAGYRAVAGTSVRDAWSAFEILDAKTWQQYSQFTLTSFNTQKATQAALAGISVRTLADSGGVRIGAQTSLNLAGTIDFSATKGLSGTLDIVGTQLALTNDAAPEGYLRIDAAQVEKLGASSVLIGGYRPRTSHAAFDFATYTVAGIAGGVVVSTVATDVLVTPGTQVSLNELTLVASDTVVIGDNAVLKAAGTTPTDQSKLLVSGDGALVRLSSGDRIEIVRSKAAGEQGSIRIGENALMATKGALSLNAAAGFDLARTALLDVARLDLASDRINLGDAPIGEPGTTLALATVERLAASSDLLLRGYKSIEVYGDLDLGRRDAAGKATLVALTLDTALLSGHADAGAASTLTVGTLTLKNTGAASETLVTGNGALTLDVDTLALGAGDVGIGGYSGIAGKVGEIRTSGAGALRVAGEMTLATGRVLAGTASNYVLSSTGGMVLAASVAPVATAPAMLGGRLTLSGSSLSVGTDVAANAGGITLVATAGDLRVEDGASLDVSGRAVDFRDTVKFAPGGVVRLGAAGDVVLGAATLVDVSGAARGGAAGMLEVFAGGDATLAGELRASSAAGFGGGEFVLAADGTDFSDLNKRLNIGGFDASREIFLNQDIVLAAGETIGAHRVVLRSGGQVQIAGSIDARGNADHAGGGTVLLTGQTVTLSGRIDAAAGVAAAGGYAPASGNVELAGASVSLAAGSSIDLSGGRQGGGRLMVRADRTGSATLGATVTGAREQTLVGMAYYETSTIDAGTVASTIGEANAWLAGASGPAGWNVGAGMAFVSTGDLTVAADIDLAAIDGAGYLGLSAAGDILVNGTISDGFSSAAADGRLQEGRSFSYDFDAGQDVVIGADRVVRTGTGDIRVGAGRDLVLTSNGSVIYAAGSATPTAAGFDHTGFSTAAGPGIRVLGDFPTLGGDVTLEAGRDILAPIVTQSASAWLFRYGVSGWNGNPNETSVTEQTSWSIVYGNFKSGVASFGGGDVRVRAGRDIWDLGVAVPTTGHLTTHVGNHALLADLVVRGGGDLDLRAVGDLRGGFVVMGRGHGELTAGGDVGGGKVTQVLTGNVFDNTNMQDRGMNLVFGLMDADVRVTGGGNVAVEGAYDLTLVAQVCANFGDSCGVSYRWADGNGYGFPAGSVIPSYYEYVCGQDASQCNVTGAPAYGSSFVGYSARTAIDMIAVGGNADYLNNGYAGTSVSLKNADETFWITPKRPPNGDPRMSTVAAAQVAPGILKLSALSGDIALTPLAIAGAGLQLAPSPHGTLELLAAGDITLGYGTQLPLQLQDIAVEYIRTALAPARTDNFSLIDFAAIPAQDLYATVGNNFYRGYTPLHLGDPDPVRIVALTGSISGKASYGQDDWRLISPKPIDIYAGEDVVWGVLGIQHNDPTEVSRIVAGRDLLHRNGQFGYSILGEGLLWIEAGRNYVAGNGSITSAGNGSVSGASNSVGSNLALPDRGADITLIAGTAQGSDYDGFAKLYLDPANLADPAFPLSHPSNAGKVVRTYEKELDQYLLGLGLTGVDATSRKQLFAALSVEKRGVFLHDVLTRELQQTGIDYNDPKGSRFQQYTRGYAALARLFPATAALNSRDNPLGGDILLNGGQVESRSGGSIQVIAPFGRLGVGAPGLDQFIGASTQTGVITRRGGDVGMIANGSISLDLSRVFTLQGGDLLMWTSYGDITAGVGAKTSVTNIPLSFRQDRFGEVSIDAFGLATGAGIGVLDSLQGEDDNRKKSRLDLLAFFGEVNAGDAGIRVIGDLNIAALRVINAANIEVSGDATGIPTIAAVNVGALTSASTAASSVTMAATRLAERGRQQTVREVPSILNVRFLGFGA